MYTVISGIININIDCMSNEYNMIFFLEKISKIEPIIMPKRAVGKYSIAVNNPIVIEECERVNINNGIAKV